MSLKAIILISLLIAAAACSRGPDRPPATVAELERVTAAKDAHQIATFIFENYGCKNCHTISSGGKFGFTPTGLQLKNKSEGCVALLTAVSRIATMPQSNRTAEHNEKLAHFNDYGCTACHRISFGNVDLTEVGAKLRVLHFSCPDVQKVLN
jgi:cytochrome c551/c552